MKRIAVISDISALGRCSLSAALPVISAIGAECCPIPGTVLTNQTGYESYKARNLADFMPEYIAEWKKISFSPDAILSGYLGDINQVRFVSRFIDTFGKNSLVAVDPAMAESGSIYKGFTDEMCRQIKALCAKSDIITPNLSEFCILTGEKYEDYLNKDKSYLTDRISEKAKSLFGERDFWIKQVNLYCFYQSSINEGFCMFGINNNCILWITNIDFIKIQKLLKY